MKWIRNIWNYFFYNEILYCLASSKHYEGNCNYYSPSESKGLKQYYEGINIKNLRTPDIIFYFLHIMDEAILEQTFEKGVLWFIFLISTVQCDDDGSTESGFIWIKFSFWVLPNKMLLDSSQDGQWGFGLLLLRSNQIQRQILK